MSFSFEVFLVYQDRKVIKVSQVTQALRVLVAPQGCQDCQVGQQGLRWMFWMCKHLHAFVITRDWAVNPGIPKQSLGIYA